MVFFDQRVAVGTLLGLSFLYPFESFGGRGARLSGVYTVPALCTVFPSAPFSWANNQGVSKVFFHHNAHHTAGASKNCLCCQCNLLIACSLSFFHGKKVQLS
jgi:hypothetical protein